jgi:hypothetical protein
MVTDMGLPPAMHAFVLSIASVLGSLLLSSISLSRPLHVYYIAYQLRATYPLIRINCDHPRAAGNAARRRSLNFVSISLCYRYRLYYIIRCATPHTHTPRLVPLLYLPAYICWLLAAAITA